MDARPPTRRYKLLLAILAISLVAIGLVLTWDRDGWLDFLIRREGDLLAFRDRRPYLVLAIAFTVYLIMAGLSLPVATWYGLFLGWYLGFWRALLLVSFASTAGATLAFLTSRYLLRDWVRQRWPKRFASINDAVEKEGKWYLLSLRLIPIFPYYLINLAMGVTTMRAWTFWWVSQLGMLPGTTVNMAAGAALPGPTELRDNGWRSLARPQLLIAMVAIGTLPLVLRWLWKRFAPKPTPAKED